MSEDEEVEGGRQVGRLIKREERERKQRKKRMERKKMKKRRKRRGGDRGGSSEGVNETCSR